MDSLKNKRKQQSTKTDDGLDQKNSESSYFPNAIKQKLVISNDSINALINLFNNDEVEACIALALKLTSAHPENGFCWKVLGTVYQNKGLNAESIEALNQAAKLLKNDADIHYNLANAYYDLLEETLAVKHYRKAIKIKPDFLNAHYNLGSIYFKLENYALAEKHLTYLIKQDPEHSQAHLQLTKVYDAQGKHTLAIELLKTITAIHTDSGEAYLSLAVEYQKTGMMDEALAAFEKALELSPQNIDIHNNYGLHLKTIKAYHQSESVLIKGLEYAPKSAELLNNLGLLFLDQHKVSEATYYLQKALVTNPDNILGYINYGLMMLNTGDVTNAGAYFLKALEIDAQNLIALNNLGLALIAAGKFEDAVEYLYKALAIDPNYVPALSNLSTPLKRLGRLTEAENNLKKALSICPDAHDVYVNLASIYQGKGFIKEAIEYNLKAIEVRPEVVMPYSNLLFSMCYSSDFSKAFVMEHLHNYGDVVTASATFQYNEWATKKQSNRLKVGFVSADFILHPVTSFLSTVLENIDTEKFELFAYTNLPKEDEITQQIKPLFSGWKSIVGLSDASAAQLIHDDGIDLLIDLSGHSAGNRLPMFAYKPAPVQATWLGYWASSGVEEIDYIILDEMSAPREIANQFTEQIHYVPETRFCYSPPNEKLDVSPLPALKNGYVTIGCYHNYAKVSDAVLAVWAEVLNQSPNTVFRWQTTAFADQSIVGEVQEKFKAIGVDVSRIQLLPATVRLEYLLSYHQIDFVLDCFPFTACTTTSDALWMGVPTLAIAGDSLVARQSTSLMHAVGLPDWIANDSAEYVQKALTFANDVDGLANIRGRLRAQLLDSTLGNAEEFTRNIETAFIAMHQQKVQPLIESDANEANVSHDAMPVVQQEQVTGDEQQLLIEECYVQALNLQQDGHDDEAEKIYLDILAVEPQHPDANHNIGFIEYRKVSAQAALARFQVAIEGKPNVEQYWVSYVDALMQTDATQETVERYLTLGQQHGLTKASADLLLAEYEAGLLDQRVDYLKHNRTYLNDNDKAQLASETVLISLCIPTYNRAHTLSQTLKSITSQAIFVNSNEVEVVVADNGSTDNTQEVVEAYEAQFPGKIKYIRNKMNIGAAFNFELVLSKGKGQFLKLLNDNLKMRDGSLTELLDVVRSTTNEKPVIFLTNGIKPVEGHMSIANNLTEFVQHTSYYATWIGSFGLWRDTFHEISDFSKSAEILLPQTDILFRMIAGGKPALVMTEVYFVPGEGEVKKGGYNIAEVFGQNYLSLLKQYVESGQLAADVYAVAKKDVLINHIVPYYFDQSNDFQKTGFFPFMQDYLNEDYFYEAIEGQFFNHKSSLTKAEIHQKNVAAKWREMNPHNETIWESKAHLNTISVGRKTYGTLVAYSYGHQDEKLTIGSFVSIADNVTFLLGGNHPYTGVSTFPFKAKYFAEREATTKGPIIIEDDVWVGMNTLILSGITIGQGAIIAAGSVVTRDVEPYAIVGGNPAKLIKYRFDQAIVDKLKQFDFSQLRDESILSNKTALYDALTVDNVDATLRGLQ